MVVTTGTLVTVVTNVTVVTTGTQVTVVTIGMVVTTGTLSHSSQ